MVPFHSQPPFLGSPRASGTPEKPLRTADQNAAAIEDSTRHPRKSNASQKALESGKYIGNSHFEPSAMASSSKIAAALCSWVHAVYAYHVAFVSSKPSRERHAAAKVGS